MSDNKQRYEDALHHLTSALTNAEIIRDAYLQECVEPIRAKRQELTDLDDWKRIKQKSLSDLDEQIKQRQSELEDLNEWSGTKQEFVMRQIRQAMLGTYNGGEIRWGVTKKLLNQRIDDLLEISHLKKLSNGKIDELSEEIKEHRQKLADELRRGRNRLRELEGLQSQQLRFLAAVNAIASRNGFPSVPPPTIEAEKVLQNGTLLPCESGIYFLWDGPLVAYVGQSIRIAFRVCKTHERLSPTDKISYLCVDKADLFFHESFYIGVCRPLRNYSGYQKSNGKYQK